MKISFKVNEIYQLICLSIILLITGCKKDESISPVATTPKSIDFGTSTFGSVKDIEGHEYKTIVIGSKTWMAENLRVTKYQDGTSISTSAAGAEWRNNTTGAYYNYEGNKTDISLYGHLYNEYAKTDAHKVCPSGWHIPSNAEWGELASHLGGISMAGGKMKETGTNHWAAPNTSADNSSGFTGLPGGSLYLGSLSDTGTDGYWWSLEQGSFFYLTNSRTDLRSKSTALSDAGLSIRCVKD